MIEQEKRARFARRRHDVPTGPTVYLGDASPKPPLENGASERFERVAAGEYLPDPSDRSFDPAGRSSDPAERFRNFIITPWQLAEQTVGGETLGNESIRSFVFGKHPARAQRRFLVGILRSGQICPRGTTKRSFFGNVFRRTRVGRNMHSGSQEESESPGRRETGNFSLRRAYQS